MCHSLAQPGLIRPARPWRPLPSPCAHPLPPPDTFVSFDFSRAVTSLSLFHLSLSPRGALGFGVEIAGIWIPGGEFSPPLPFSLSSPSPSSPPPPVRPPCPRAPRRLGPRTRAVPRPRSRRPLGPAPPRRAKPPASPPLPWRARPLAPPASPPRAVPSPTPVSPSPRRALAGPGEPRPR
jgi:hypothetical protein